MIKTPLLFVVLMMFLGGRPLHATMVAVGPAHSLRADYLSSWSPNSCYNTATTGLPITISCFMSGQCACSGLRITAYAETYISVECANPWTLTATANAVYRGGYVDASSQAVSGPADGNQSLSYYMQRLCNGTGEFTEPYTFTCVAAGSGAGQN